MRLARFGYDNALGFLKGGFESWKNAGKPVQEIRSVDVRTFNSLREKDPDMHIIDVRRPNEWKVSHIPNAHHFPLDFINEHMAEIEPSQEYYLHCRSGYRSTIAASILVARGYPKLVDVIGSYDDIMAEAMPMGGNFAELG